MAKRSKQKASKKGRRALGAFVFLAAILLLISLVTHTGLDDARIKGDVDGHLDPFEINFRNQAGMLGAYVSYAFLVVLGWLSFFAPFGLILISLRLYASELTARLSFNSSLLFLIGMLGTVIYDIHLLVKPTIGYETGAIGGYLAINVTQISIRLVGEWGSYVIASGLIIVLLMTFTPASKLVSLKIRLPRIKGSKEVWAWFVQQLRNLFSLEWMERLRKKADQDEPEADEPEQLERHEPEPIRIETEVVEEVAPKTNQRRAPGRQSTTLKRAAEPIQLKSMEYSYPGTDLLNDPVYVGEEISRDELQMTARMLKETLETFQVSVDGAISTFPGPVITRFEFKPAAGVKINRIVGLSDDLALALKARRIRIVAPIPGKAAVGVEIPNRHPQSVFLKELIQSPDFTDSGYILPMALGKTISGKPFIADLAKMPHLLIAGATGSGKSVCMNALVTSLIFKLHPFHVRFVFIDPKMLELSVYKGIPHLGRPVVTTPKRAEKVLADIVAEMEKRYRKLAEAAVRNIEDYNRRQSEEESKLPYIVVCVDELADLMMSATSSKVEMLITRLAQMARAVGIHLILATQRPSVDVITGLIKANFPARIAFQVASKVDSRTIIDANGAEKLLGAGDMLFLSPGQPESTRLHGAYISSEETDQLVKFINDQGLPMMALEGISQATGEATEAEIDLGDPLFKEACEVVIRHKQGSVSLLQRRLGIGYQRAARLIDKLEQAGVVSTFDGSKAREVMVDQAYVDHLFATGGRQAEDQASQNPA